GTVVRDDDLPLRLRVVGADRGPRDPAAVVQAVESVARAADSALHEPQVGLGDVRVGLIVVAGEGAVRVLRAAGRIGGHGPQLVGVRIRLGARAGVVARALLRGRREGDRDGAGRLVTGRVRAGQQLETVGVFAETPEQRLPARLRVGPRLDVPSGCRADLHLRAVLVIDPVPRQDVGDV